MKLEAPRNSNYCATVVTLKEFRELAGCNNIKGAVIFGNQVVVSKDAKAGDIGVFFPVETQLSAGFCAGNNLFRKAENNADPSAKGFFEDHGRVKCAKFRGHKSEGFWIPIECLAFTGIELAYIEAIAEGASFDFIGEIEICRKYVPRRNPAGAPRGQKRPKVKPEDRLLPGQFQFHIDTENLRRNIQKILPGDRISITEKWHGTSAVYANILSQRELPWYEKLARLLGVRVQETEYQFVWSSRRVIKGVGEKPKADAQHFYSSDIWGHVAEEIRGSIPYGYTIYGEIVGFTPDGAPIQDGYHYGCAPGQHQFLVYRVTVTNPTGMVVELSGDQLIDFCMTHSLSPVRQLYVGTANGFLTANRPNLSLEQWQAELLAWLESSYVRDQPCPHNNHEVPAEGIVLRVEHLDRVEAFKLKNFTFLKRESDLLDVGHMDTETAESEPLAEAA